MAAESIDWEEIIVSDIAGFTNDPLGFVRYAYQWGEGELVGSSGPRHWQHDILSDIATHLEASKTCYIPLNEAVSSGHGIGKTALVAWIIDWAMSTCEDCKVICTANTKTQLDTKTVPEVSKWFRLSINSHWWDMNATSIRTKDPAHEKTWRADFIPWSIENTEAFAGLHNKGKRIVLIFDEASGIHDRIWEVAEGALTDETTEILWIAFGNPTQNSGRFRECFGKFKHRWITRQIDSRSVDGTNKDQIQKWIEDYGEDSDFVRVRVRGEFPRAGSNQFIGNDAVFACQNHVAVGYESMPKILSVDVARYGSDQTVIGIRQGRKARILAKYRGKDTVFTAEKAIEFHQSERTDAIVVDGDGLGAGVVDQIRSRGFARGLFEFHGGATPNDPAKYYNRRAEVWGLMRDWLYAEAEIPKDPELADDLTMPEYGFSPKGQIQLEKKEDMVKRGYASPDCGDMLAMTFAVNVAPRPKAQFVKPVSAWS